MMDSNEEEIIKTPVSQGHCNEHLSVLSSSRINIPIIRRSSIFITETKKKIVLFSTLALQELPKTREGKIAPSCTKYHVNPITSETI